jgi:ATP-dependent Clp protease ATP-binding subunit ClpB
VFHVLLQILDDGRLTDGQGRVVNFKNTIVIMTSNIGTELIGTENDKDTVKEKIQEALKIHFRPEFLNRVDETIVFNHLTQKDIAAVVDIQLALLGKRLEEKHIGLEVSSEALVFLAKEGFDPVYGARPLKRVMQRLIQDQIAMGLLKGTFKEYDKVKILYEKNGIELKKEK